MLDGKEQAIWNGRPSVYDTIPSWVFSLLLLAGVETGLIWLLPHLKAHIANLPGIAGNVMLFEITVRLGVAALLLSAPLWRTLVILSTNYLITDQRVVIGTGVLARHYDQVELFRVRDITVSKTVAQRLLGLGDLTIHSRDQTMPECHFRAIKDPFQVSDLLRKQVFASKEKRGLQEFEVT